MQRGQRGGPGRQAGPHSGAPEAVDEEGCPGPHEKKLAPGAAGELSPVEICWGGPSMDRGGQSQRMRRAGGGGASRNQRLPDRKGNPEKGENQY